MHTARGINKPVEAAPPAAPEKVTDSPWLYNGLAFVAGSVLAVVFYKVLNGWWWRGTPELAAAQAVETAIAIDQAAAVATQTASNATLSPETLAQIREAARTYAQAVKA